MSLYNAWNLVRQLHRARWFVFVVNFAFGLALVVTLGRSMFVGWRQILEEGLAIRVPCLGIALGLYGTTFFLFVVAWHKITIRFGGPRSWRQNVIFYSVTHPTRFLPTPVWLFASRIYLYGQAGMRRRTVILTTGVESLLHALAGLGFWAVFAVKANSPATWLYFLAIIPVVAVVTYPSRLRLPGVNENMNLHRSDVISWVALYLLTWLIAGPFFSAIICAFGEDVPPLWELWRIWTLASLAAYIGSYSLGGAGFLREFTLTWLLSSFYSPPIAVLIAASTRIIMIGGGILWGVIAIGCVILQHHFSNYILDRFRG